jgi:hypothetical protein
VDLQSGPKPLRSKGSTDPIYVEASANRPAEAALIFYFTLLLRCRHNNTMPAITTEATTLRAPNEFIGSIHGFGIPVQVILQM